jgi:hypothetical protein
MPQALPRFVSEDDLDELKPEAGPEHVYDDPNIAPMLRIKISQAKGNKRGRKVFSIRFGRNGRKDVAGYNSDKPGLYIRQDEFDRRKKDAGAKAVTGRTTLTAAIAEAFRVKKALSENEEPYPDRQPKKRRSYRATPGQSAEDARGAA